MSKQLSFSSVEYTGKKKVTRQEIFLNEMEAIVPMDIICEAIRPYYAVKGNGRPPIDLEIMVRMYLVSQWYDLSDELTEDNIYNNVALRNFVGIDLSERDVPDSTTLCKFRQLLEDNNITKNVFENLNKHYEESGKLFKKGSIVDATIISAPDTTHNKDNKRDPEMSSTQKNSKWYFGFKTHIGVDEESGIVHSLEVTTAKTHDAEVAVKVLHGDEEIVYGDSAYTGLDKRADMMEKFGYEVIEPERKGKRGKTPNPIKVVDSNKVQIRTNKKRSSIEKLEDGWKKDLSRAYEKLKVKVRYKAELPFRIMKCVFGFRKTRLKGLHKNQVKLYMMFALVNIYFVNQQNKKQQKNQRK